VCERTFAHICDTGGIRRTWLRGFEKVSKRYSIAAAAHNLGRMLRTLLGIGKPRALQGEVGLASLARLVIEPVIATMSRRVHFLSRVLFPSEQDHPFRRCDDWPAGTRSQPV
jgi:hypothetical protein